MKDPEDIFEQLRPGDTVSVENSQDRPLSISIVAAEGTRLNMQLAPRQVLEFSAGKSDAQIILREGDPAGLLVVKPDTPS